MTGLIRTGARRWLVLVAATLLTGPACRPDRITVELTVSAPQAIFARGARVALGLMLENTGTVPAGVSGQLDGTVFVVSLKRDGIDVPVRETEIDFDEDLAVTLERSLRSTPPGGRIRIPWTSTDDRPLGGQALRTVGYASDGRHIARYYAVGEPGMYELTVAYRYPGPTGAFARVFDRASNESRVTFSVNP